jgi:TolA-binding protein
MHSKAWLFRGDKKVMQKETQKETSSHSRESFVPRPWGGPGFFVLLAFSALLATQIVSCAYYNTFYSARKYYLQAVRVAQQTAKPARTSTTTTAPAPVPAQVSALLDRSIEKCAKVISVFPKSKWVDDAIFLLGACYYEKHEYDKSIKKFNELSMYYPKSPLIPRAQFLTGMCYSGKKDYDRSSPILEKILKEYPNFENRETILYTLGEASSDKKKYAEALPYYRLVAGKKKSKLYFETLSRIGECYFEMAKYDSARISLSAVVANSPNAEQALDALIKIGDSYSSEKSYDAKEFGRVPVVRLRMASVATQKGDYKKAIEIYQSVVNEFPRTIQASEAQFRIGYIHEVNLEDLESASTAYAKVKEHSSVSEFALMADLRSKGLAKIKEFNQAAQASEGEKAAESAFLIAELSLFQLGKPDKAIEKYLSVEKDFPTTSFAPKSAYAAAYVFFYLQQDTVSAVEIFKRVVKRFPRSEYAAAAREILVNLGIEPPQEEPVEVAPQGLPEELKPGEKGEIQETGKPVGEGKPEEKGAIEEVGKPPEEGTPPEQEKPPEKVGPSEVGEFAEEAKPPEGGKIPEKATGFPAPADTLRADTLRNETR